jgi:hypothetical protein
MTIVLWTATAFAGFAFIAQVAFIVHLVKKHRFRSSVEALNASRNTRTADPSDP